MEHEPALAELTEAQREQAMARFAVLRSHIEDDVPLPRAAVVDAARSTLVIGAN